MRLIRGLLRFLGWIVALLALAVLAATVAQAVKHGAPTLGKVWADLDRDSLLLFQAAIERYLWNLGPFLWGRIIQPMLERPAALVFVVLAALALVLFLITRRRRDAY
jgi:hypothetical protein